MTDVGTDLEQYLPREAIATVLSGTSEAFVEFTEGMDSDELMDVGFVLSANLKANSIKIGYVAHKIRMETPDGLWGQAKYKMAEQWGVSDRTIQRWLVAAQEAFGLELTAGQRNARVSSSTDDASEEEESWITAGPEEEAMWSDPDFGDDDFFDGVRFPDPDEDMEASESLLSKLNREAGWGNDTLPSAEYTNAPESEPPAGKPLALEPDPMWVAWTVSQIQEEHDNAYGDEAARRMATSRWAGRLEQAPLDLLEELEVIHGDSISDHMVEVLHQLEENKIIKPDEVIDNSEKKPKRASGGSGGKVATAKFSDGLKNAENAMVFSRNLHEHIYNLKKEGPEAVLQYYGNALGPLQSWVHTAGECLKHVKEAKEAVMSTRAQTSTQLASEPPEEDQNPGF